MANWLTQVSERAKQELQLLGLWSMLEVPVSIFVAYAGAQWATYVWIGNRYAIDFPLSLYLSSYISRQLTCGFMGLLILFVLLRWNGRWIRGASSLTSQDKCEPFTFTVLIGERVYHTTASRTEAGPVRTAKDNLASLVRCLCIVLCVAVPTISLVAWQMPHRVSHIHIKFLDEPDFDKYAFVYLLYELNRQQSDWHFDVDFDTFREKALTAEEKTEFEGPDQMLRFAEFAADDSLMIAVTSRSLGDDSFWQMRGKVSVISTDRWERLYSPPSVYEYLSHSVIALSVILHLSADEHLPIDSFDSSRKSYGGLFQFAPRRNAMRAQILAPNLTMKGRALLLNRFGIEYLERCERLLTLGWMQSDPVKGNLATCFNVIPRQAESDGASHHE